MPFPGNEIAIIFSDSLGIEYKGNYAPYSSSFCLFNSTYQRDPNNAESRTCDFSYEAEYITSSMSFTDFGEMELKFTINTDIKVLIEYDQEIVYESDFLNVLLFENDKQNFDNKSFLGSNGRIGLRVDGRFHETIDDSFIVPTHIIEEFKIHNKVFRDVIVPIETNDFEYNIYLSEQVGLVGFENKDKSISLKFERFE